MSKKYTWLALIIFSFVFSKLIAIEGTYIGGGFDPYFKNFYSTKMIVTKDKNDVYQATWYELEDRVKYHYKGTGIKTGGQINFVFQSVGDAPDRAAGIQVYIIDGDTLEGPYVYINKNLVGTEKVQKQY